MWPEWIYSQGVYFEPRAGDEVRICRFHNNKQSNKTKTKTLIMRFDKKNWKNCFNHHFKIELALRFDIHMILRLHNIRAHNRWKKCCQKLPLPLAGEAQNIQAAEAASSVWPVKLFHGNNFNVFSHDVQACIGIWCRAPNHFWFLVCHAATQLAQLHQEHVQVVRSNREPPEAPGPRALPQWTLNWKAYAYTCRQKKNKWKKTYMKKHGTWMNNTHPTQQLILYFFLSI